MSAIRLKEEHKVFVVKGFAKFMSLNEITHLTKLPMSLLLNLIPNATNYVEKSSLPLRNIQNFSLKNIAVRNKSWMMIDLKS